MQRHGRVAVFRQDGNQRPRRQLFADQRPLSATDAGPGLDGRQQR